MRLTDVIIKNFRSIKEIKINFTPSCRILVGINESGKTNILRALSLLDPEILPKHDDVREISPNESPSQESFVRFVFALDKSERTKAYENFAPKILSFSIDKPIIEISGNLMNLEQFFEFRKESLYQVNIVDEQKYRTVWSLPKKSKIVGKWKTVKTSPTPPAVTLKDESISTLANFSIINFEDYPDIAPSFLGELTVEGLNSLVSSAIKNSTKDNFPSCLFWSYNEANLLPGQIQLDTFAADPNYCLPLKYMFALAGYDQIQEEIESAQQRSNGIRNLLKRVSDQSTKHLHSVWKEHQGIKLGLQQNGINIEATIEDTHNAYNLSRRSDGFKRFVTFLLMVSAKAKTNQLENTLYLHDEPDTSLHPSGARYLREELIKIAANNNFVVYSTHSIFMIDRSHIARHYLVRKKNEITMIDEVNESNIVDEEVIYNALGSSIFESLKEKNIVFEGWRDKELFRIALNKLSSGQKALKNMLAEIGTCHAKGVKDVSRITPMLELANRQCLILTDADQPAIEHQKSHKDHKGYGTWLRYDELLDDSQVVTAEDFIKPEAFQSILKIIRSENPSLSEFDLSDLKIEGGRLKVIEKWLGKGGIGKDDSKPILNRIKEDIFINLAPKNIESSYYILLEALSQHLSNSPEVATLEPTSV